MTIFNKKAFQIASIPLKAVSFVLTAPIVLVQCLFKFLASLLKWVNNKIEKLFEHKSNENKFTHIMKDLGNFIVSLPTKILEFACNLINVILDLTRIIIKDTARIFQEGNQDLDTYDEDDYKSLNFNIDLKFSDFMMETMEKFDKKINPNSRLYYSEESTINSFGVEQSASSSSSASSY